MQLSGPPFQAFCFMFQVPVDRRQQIRRSASRCNNTAGRHFCLAVKRYCDSAFAWTLRDCSRVPRGGCNPAKSKPNTSLALLVQRAQVSRLVLVPSIRVRRPAPCVTSSVLGQVPRKSMDVARQDPASATARGRESHVSMVKRGLTTSFHFFVDNPGINCRLVARTGTGLPSWLALDT
jgi:hypothetical protein